jgi:hypothetical protein
MQTGMYKKVNNYLWGLCPHTGRQVLISSGKSRLLAYCAYGALAPPTVILSQAVPVVITNP